MASADRASVSEPVSQDGLSLRHGTPVGTVDGTRPGVVDSHGAVTPGTGDATWTLDWWIGGDDRWYVPEREVTLRQSLVDDTPVVETAVRVPSGDAVHRAYGVVAGDQLVDGLLVV